MEGGDIDMEGEPTESEILQEQSDLRCLGLLWILAQTNNKQNKPKHTFIRQLEKYKLEKDIW